MNFVKFIPIIIAALIFLRWLAEAGLELLNRRRIQANAGSIPEAFRDTMDLKTYTKSVEYSLARLEFSRWEDGWGTIVLFAVLFSGFLPVTFSLARKILGQSEWSDTVWLFAVGTALAIPGLPFDWWGQFRLEERFGFNTSNLKVWCLDRMKGFLLALILGFPLITLILKLVGWIGPTWWLWAWVTLLAFQLLMTVLAPSLILPLFNKLTPLPEGALRERLLNLGARTGFSAQTILVMDGSKRSRHSNAFFTGFGRFRKIVLFDTLIQQLSDSELEAVLAHEIGHYKRGHIPRMLAVSAFQTLAGFWLIGWLMQAGWLAEAVGFAPDAGLAPVLLLFSLLSGSVTFWVSPLMNSWSRRHEYQADAYAAEAMKERQSLVGALRKLSEKNLSNLTPHPAYSAWHYSHPTLLEREAALEKVPV
jgi:STE24 endopeptidase